MKKIISILVVVLTALAFPTISHAQVATVATDSLQVAPNFDFTKAYKKAKGQIVAGYICTGIGTVALVPTIMGAAEIVRYKNSTPDSVGETIGGIMGTLFVGYPMMIIGGAVSVTMLAIGIPNLCVGYNKKHKLDAMQPSAPEMSLSLGTTRDGLTLALRF